MWNMLEKLINEHGSATILKERLGLKSDHIEALQREYSQIMEQQKELVSENRELRIKLDEAHAEIKRLQDQLQISTDSNTAHEFKPEEMKILEFLFKNDDHFALEFLAQVIGADSNTAKYYVNNLLDKEMLYRSLWFDAPATFRISDSAVKYMVERDRT